MVVSVPLILSPQHQEEEEDADYEALTFYAIFPHRRSLKNLDSPSPKSSLNLRFPWFSHWELLSLLSTPTGSPPPSSPPPPPPPIQAATALLPICSKPPSSVALLRLPISQPDSPLHIPTMAASSPPHPVTSPARASFTVRVPNLLSFKQSKLPASGAVVLRRFSIWSPVIAPATILLWPL